MIHFKSESSAMDQVIEIYKPQRELNTYDDIGVHPRQDTLVLKCWAAIIPMTGSSVGSRDRLVIAETTHKFIIRPKANIEIEPDMLIKHKGKEFEVLYVLNPYEKNEVLEIFAKHRAMGSGYYG